MQLRVALAFARVVGLLLPRPMPVAAPAFLRQGAEPEAAPGARHAFVLLVGVGWLGAGVVVWAATIAWAFVGHLLAGSRGDQVGMVVSALLYAVVAGGILATVPYLYWANWADRHAKGAVPGSPEEARVKAAVRRARPSDRVVLTVQALAVLFTLWLVTGH